MVRLAERLERLPPYLFARIDAAMERARQRGLDTVSMGIGDPDHDPPQWIRELLCEEVMRSGNHRYPGYKGNPRLHEAAIRYLERRFGVRGLGLEHVLTTIGSKEGVANLVTGLINPGDHFLMPDPAYPVFGTMAKLLGAHALALPVHPATGFLPDPREEISPEQAERARVMFVNYPHNPTGKVAPKAYLQSLVDFALEHGIVIVSDAAYMEIYYGEENKPPSLLECEGALECTIELHSFSKSFNMTGWRVGFAAGSPELIKGLLAVKSNVDSGCFNAIQLTMARVLDDERCDAFLAENRARYQQRLERVCAALDEMGIKIHRPGGTIFVWCELPENAGSMRSGAHGKGETAQDSFAWCERLLDSTGLVTAPGAGYGRNGEGFFRLSLTTPDEDIDRALIKLRAFVNP
ncbi:aminotransferase class I/II-fold pyridoxal phosphate-dependent enzyme [bacterium]|nr:aminotransferase class I/II-fold pyridoxal phosphate-dependent enzyme [bacterium]